ncbi:putative ankyrin repeat protein RF_0381 [Microplitis mediator]|uniref:putative ankyrin repeat protein RF_0381 n=1 Tax=Microplitis mediator TaxID=375433 RepID=UPI00255263F8|nr:putative ankyrin repeat protein RF_0381 [Microplitis mediator]
MRKSTKQKLRIRQSKMREVKIHKSRIRKYNYKNRMDKLRDFICAIESHHKDYIDNVTTENVNIDDNGVDVNAALENNGFITGETALHLAAATGTKEIIKLLLDNNANINAKNIKGITPIISAVEAKNDDAMDVLMEHGPDLFCTYKEYRYSVTIFHAAISSSNWEFLSHWLFLFADTRDVNNNSFFFVL